MLVCVSAEAELTFEIIAETGEIIKPGLFRRREPICAPQIGIKSSDIWSNAKKST